jgi:hypothetical protein
MQAPTLRLQTTMGRRRLPAVAKSIARIDLPIGVLSACFRQQSEQSHGAITLLGLVFPQVVQPTDPSTTAEDPDISGRIDVADSTPPCPRNVVGRRRSLGSVRRQLVGDVRPAHPRPLSSVVLRKVIEDYGCTGRVVPIPAEEPEVPGPIGRTNSRPPCSRNVARGSQSLGANVPASLGMFEPLIHVHCPALYFHRSLSPPFAWIE